MRSSSVAPVEPDGIERLRLLVRVSQQLGALQDGGDCCRLCSSRLSRIAELGTLQRQLFESIAVQLPSAAPAPTD